VKSDKKNYQANVSRLGIALSGFYFLTGCSLVNVPMLNPKGPIALAQRDLLLSASAIMLVVVLPVFVMTFWIVFRYRASQHNPDYQPDWDKSRALEAVIWLVPAAIVIAIGQLVWTYSHELDPYRPIASDQPTVNVQVIALDWKWLFIYPQYNVASVNELVFPANAPLRLSLTSDTVMNSLSIPALAGQIYAMAGMQTELNLLATEVGIYKGRNVQYSGEGFSDQTFVANAMTQQDFETWIARVRLSPQPLDALTYKTLSAPSEANPVEHYGHVEPDFFKRVIVKYMHDHTASVQEPLELPTELPTEQPSAVQHVR
jgi:cytochrome o ubiquinol oxidase subunit 2